MRATRARKRRAALVLLGVPALAAFALGAARGRDTVSTPAPGPASGLSTEQLAGQRIVVGFHGAEPPAALVQMVRAGRIAGVILFGENLPSRASARRLVRALQSIKRPPGLRDPLLVMIDQEGGLVKRLGGAPSVSARRMGDRGAAFSREQGRRTARNLRDAGVNVDLAPVLDVARPGGTIADTDRGFGATAAAVAATAVPFAEGLQNGGVAAAAKHFPGMGAAQENTDFAVERIELSKAELRRVDEAPYGPFVKAGGEIVMLSTAIYPAFSSRPAAFSRPIATGELRERLGFEGVSITDALETVAVRDFGGPAKAGLAGANAGVDLLLFADLAAGARAQRALDSRLRSRKLKRPIFEGSAERVLALRDGLDG